ncbi:MAG: RNA 3'-terminal phosphate cyclase [archaeon]|nr:RNA 3'-terminal phosphate cyclase [archaeon]
MNFLEIDGNMGEGGGAILRLSAGFSVLFNKPIHIKNIRAGRSKPGLRLQHMLGLLALKEITDGSLSDIEVGTTELKFSPGDDFKSQIDVNIRTAGSIALLSQTIQTAAIKSDLNKGLIVNVNGGGTFGLGAPDPYYLNDVTYRYFEKMGYSCKINVLKNGYYPKGGAAAVLRFSSLADPINELKPLNINKIGDLVRIGGNIIVSDALKKPRVGERIHNGIVTGLIGKNIEIPDYEDNTLGNLKCEKKHFEINLEYVKALNPGVGLSIWAEFDSGIILSSGTILGKRGVSSEKVADTAVISLLKQIKSGATVDEYLADQIIPLLYLCRESSCIIVPRITTHMQTNIDLLNMFGKRKYLTKKLGKAWRFKYY